MCVVRALYNYGYVGYPLCAYSSGPFLDCLLCILYLKQVTVWREDGECTVVFPTHACKIFFSVYVCIQLAIQLSTWPRLEATPSICLVFRYRNGGGAGLTSFADSAFHHTVRSPLTGSASQPHVFYLPVECNRLMHSIRTFSMFY